MRPVFQLASIGGVAFSCAIAVGGSGSVGVICGVCAVVSAAGASLCVSAVWSAAGCVTTGLRRIRSPPVSRIRTAAYRYAPLRRPTDLSTPMMTSGGEGRVSVAMPSIATSDGVTHSGAAWASSSCHCSSANALSPSDSVRRTGVGGGVSRESAPMRVSQALVLVWPVRPSSGSGAKSSSQSDSCERSADDLMVTVVQPHLPNAYSKVFVCTATSRGCG